MIISERSSENSRCCNGAPLYITFLRFQVYVTLPEFYLPLCLISDTVSYITMLSVAGVMLCDCMWHLRFISIKYKKMVKRKSVLCEFWGFYISIAEGSIFGDIMPLLQIIFLDILNPLYCCIMSGTNYQVMQHNIPEEHTLEEEYLLEKLWHMITSAVFYIWELSL